MINNNMKMIQNMANAHNYEEYVEKCKKVGIEPRNLQQFCMGMGVLMVAINRYPKLSWQKAYSKLFLDINAESEAEANTPKVKKKKGCCGGKPVNLKLPFKHRLMEWSRKYNSKCDFCGGMRIGVAFMAILWLIKEIVIGG